MLLKDMLQAREFSKQVSCEQASSSLASGDGGVVATYGCLTRGHLVCHPCLTLVSMLRTTNGRAIRTTGASHYTRDMSLTERLSQRVAVHPPWNMESTRHRLPLAGATRHRVHQV